VGFEYYTPNSGYRRVTPGQARVNRVGHIRFHAEDLRKIGLTGRHVVALYDRGTVRLGLRNPREGEDGFAEPTIALRQAKNRTSAEISGSGVLRLLGLDPEQLAGDHPIQHKDDVLIVLFNGGPAAAAAEAQAARFKRKTKKS